jgi:hypothetical protein
VGVEKSQYLTLVYFLEQPTRARVFFVSQWEQSSGDKNAGNKMKKENPPN